MLLENLKLLVNAGTDALMTTCGLAVEDVSISQVRQGQLTFPGMAKIKYQGGTLQSLRLGGDSMMCGNLAEQLDPVQGQSGIAKLAQTFLAQTLDEMEGRFPRGEVVDLEVGPRTVNTRGIRSFGLKYRTQIGQLFVLVEVPSRTEYELAKGSEYLTSMTETYLPKNWFSREKLSSSGDLDSFLVFLRKTEGDVFVEIPLDESKQDTRNGVLLEQSSVGSRRAMRINLNLENGPASLLQPGDFVTCYVGVSDRSVEMDLEYLGDEEFMVAQGSTLNTALFSLPHELRIVQRRRAFRIDLLQTVPVEVEAVEENAENPIWMSDIDPGPGAAGKMVDLSFSGARIIGDTHEFSGLFPEGSMVRCRVYFPDETGPVTILGLVRRSNAKLVDRETYLDELGIEFLATPEVDRESLDKVRQIVLKEQRSALARRVQATGVI